MQKLFTYFTFFASFIRSLQRNKLKHAFYIKERTRFSEMKLFFADVAKVDTDNVMEESEVETGILLLIHAGVAKDDVAWGKDLNACGLGWLCHDLKSKAPTNNKKQRNAFYAVINLRPLMPPPIDIVAELRKILIDKANMFKGKWSVLLTNFDALVDERAKKNVPLLEPFNVCFRSKQQVSNEQENDKFHAMMIRRLHKYKRMPFKQKEELSDIQTDTILFYQSYFPETNEWFLATEDE